MHTFTYLYRCCLIGCTLFIYEYNNQVLIINTLQLNTYRCFDKGRKTAMVFIDLLKWAHDSNLATNILLHCLSTITKLPDVLSLQLDNCFRENKNKYVLALCALLVEKKLFRKVILKVYNSELT